MKKILATFSLVIVFILNAMGSVVAFAEVSLEECDKCFQTTVNGFLQSSEVEGNAINALRKPVYDINLQHLGYVYEFEIVNGESYAIIICDNGNYIAQEFVPGTKSPYAQVDEEELCVYINSMTYLKHNGESFCDIATSVEIPEETLNALSEYAILYSDGYDTGVQHVTVTVNYQTKTTSAKSLCKRIPRYTNPGGIVNACAAVAGCNIIGFYDRYYENLIPNHTAGIEYYGYYFYNLADEYVDNVTRELYYKMNGSEAGITETNFKNGMQQYCAEKNLSCDFTQLMSGGNLSYSAVEQSMDENKPVALLLSTYTVCDIQSYSDKKTDYFVYDVYNGNHIMVGFGCNRITYQLTDGTNATYEFVYVASGNTKPLDAYFNMNYSTNINSAYKVYIH